ncbi:MAG TPA: GNAT family acetyltransferase [Novosphingobium sp.]|nr:GNAT family acetyltransferase [Novosphingobium sp.]
MAGRLARGADAMTPILAYQNRHFDGVDRLWRTVFPGDPPRNRAAQAIPAKLALGDDLLLVAETPEGAVIGTIMAGWDGHRGWLYAVAVDPAAQRGGVGRRLVEAALARLAERGCGKVNLQVREGNEAVVAFYHRLGFDVEPRTSMGRTL